MGNVVSSTIFCVRNTNKVENGDLGRVPVAIGQGRNVVNSVMSCDHSVGKAAKTAVDSFNAAAKNEPLLKYLGKGVNFVGDHINPLICASAGIKVLTSDDKASTLTTQASALSGMFFVEGQMKKHLQGGIDNVLEDVNKLRNKKSFEKAFETTDKVLEKCKLKGKVGKVLYGLVFVVGSCAGYNYGEKAGNMLVDGIKKEGMKPAATNKVDQKA